MNPVKEYAQRVDAFGRRHSGLLQLVAAAAAVVVIVQVMR